MLSSAAERAETVRKPPVALALVPSNEAELRQELDALNSELKELKSTDHAVRAYVESWLMLVCGSVAGKLVFDWQRTHGKTPWFAIPLGILGLVFAADAIRHRVLKARLAKHEAVKMDRQRELRSLLGVDEAPVPPLDQEPRQPVLA